MPNSSLMQRCMDQAMMMIMKKKCAGSPGPFIWSCWLLTNTLGSDPQWNCLFVILWNDESPALHWMVLTIYCRSKTLSSHSPTPSQLIAWIATQLFSSAHPPYTIARPAVCLNLPPPPSIGGPHGVNQCRHCLQTLVPFRKLWEIEMGGLASMVRGVGEAWQSCQLIGKCDWITSTSSELRSLTSKHCVVLSWWLRNMI